MPKYVIDRYMHSVLKDVVETLHDVFNYIKIDRIVIVRSYGSKTKAFARIYSLPSIWRYVLGIEPIYIIEIVDENFSKLSKDTQIRVLIHEILHIPYKFSGGLRQHGKYVNSQIVNKIYMMYVNRKSQIQ
jgi:predicted metallopeptidase